MTEASAPPAQTGAAGPAEPSDTEHVVQLPGRTIHLVGTAHISARSVDEVREVIKRVRPDSVCVELDAARHKALADREAWREMDVVQVVRRKQASMLLAHLILASFQRRLGEQLGIRPGAEMLQAVESAREVGAELVLADREIQITLRRTWGALRWWDKLRLLGQLMMMVVASPGISQEEIEALKEKDMLSQVMDTFARTFPRVHAPLIGERDVYLAEKIRTAPGASVVAVVGAGHVPGILARLQGNGPPADLAPLLTVPPRGRVVWALQWLIPLLVFGLIGYGFYAVNASVSLQMIKVWVLANGILSALGALLALAHPVTIAVAFVAAPITSLNPMIAAGWVAGLCEAALRRPKVRDFEALPHDIVTFRGFWRNGITRILLVVALANLGSSIGTFVGLPLMTRLLG
ncbi:MAG TPA: TraB/GumN family protein [bacterium]|nr:TraB/GumN family protein [bacterium]